MEDSALLAGVLVLLAVLVVLYWAYTSCRLDSVLSAKLQKCAGASSSGGAAGGTTAAAGGTTAGGAATTKDKMWGLGAPADRPDLITPYIPVRDSWGRLTGDIFNAGNY